MTEKFSFKIDSDRKALDQVKSEKKSLGRPKENKKPRNKQVGCYLTEDELSLFREKLDGRPASDTIRKLILRYID